MIVETTQPLVSVYCLTYNHEKYIRDCLDGFVMQKTDFPFEVIVHDDASTDSTQSIIREYERKYPDIIKPIYQSVNQRQLKVPKMKKFIYPQINGKYVAVCEGDDFWIDEEKLQKQVSIMEEHPECHFCVCGVQEVSLNKTPLGYCHPNEPIHDEIIDSSSFIRYASKYSFQTSSYFMRYEDWKEFILNPPDYKAVSDIGDITMLLYFGSLGKTAYINRVMSCYRRGAPTSYSADKIRWTETQRVAHFEKQSKVWKLFDESTGKRFHSTCVKRISEIVFGYFILLKQAEAFFRKENREYFSVYRFPKKMFIVFSCVFKESAKRHYLSTMKKREAQQSAHWDDA